jgi:hypothetical protein
MRLTLTKPAPPKQVTSALNTSLGDFLDPNDPSTTALLQYSEAHEVYTIGLDQIQAGNPDLNTMATSVGWRFLAAGGSNAGCHVSASGPKLSGLASAPEIRTIAQRLAQIDDLAAKPTGAWATIPPGDYELRALRIPGLLMEAVWLHSPNAPQNDQVVPLAGFQGLATWQLDLLQPIPAYHFFAQIQSAAAARLTEHNRVYPLP